MSYSIRKDIMPSLITSLLMTTLSISALFASIPVVMKILFGIIAFLMLLGVGSMISHAYEKLRAFKKYGYEYKISLFLSRHDLHKVMQDIGLECSPSMITGSPIDFISKIIILDNIAIDFGKYYKPEATAKLIVKLFQAKRKCAAAWHQHSLDCENERDKNEAQQAAHALGYKLGLSVEDNLKFDH